MRERMEEWALIRASRGLVGDQQTSGGLIGLIGGQEG
jgi:hypothetical protein